MYSQSLSLNQTWIEPKTEKSHYHCHCHCLYIYCTVKIDFSQGMKMKNSMKDCLSWPELRSTYITVHLNCVAHILHLNCVAQHMTSELPIAQYVYVYVYIYILHLSCVMPYITSELSCAILYITSELHGAIY